MSWRYGVRVIGCMSWMLAATLLTMPRVAGAQTPPDSSGVAKPDTAAATPAPAAVTPAPAAAAPAAAAPAAASATASASSAAPVKAAGMFSKGNKRVSGMVGWGHSFDTDYLLLGVGVGYFVANGLDVGVDFEGWLVGDPTVYKLSPRADYVLWKAKRIKPYAGAFYRWNFVGSGIDDQSSLGGRAGAFYQSRGGRSMAGAGVVYERYLNLDERLGSSDVVYPEVFVTVAF